MFERFLNDWSGPSGRLARMTFKMVSSIFAGDAVTITGTVDQVLADGPCGAAVAVTMQMSVGSLVATSCDALYALPPFAGDNPWDRRGAQWLRPD